MIQTVMYTYCLIYIHDSWGQVQIYHVYDCLCYKYFTLSKFHLYIEHDGSLDYEIQSILNKEMKITGEYVHSYIICKVM